MIYALIHIGMSILIGIIFILAALIVQKIHQQILMQYTAYNDRYFKPYDSVNHSSIYTGGEQIKRTGEIMNIAYKSCYKKH